MRRPLLVLGLLLLGSAPALAGRPGPPVGSVAPDFTAYDAVTHDKIRLSAQTGKVVVLTFWATWCAPCRRELPVLETLQQQVSKDQLVVFAVPFHEPDSTYGALVKAAHSWRMTLLTDRWGYVAEHYRIDSIPHLFVIGRDGRIAAEHLGYGGQEGIDTLVDEVNAALKAGPAVAAGEDHPTTR